MPPRITRRTFIRTMLYGTLGTSLAALGGAYYTTRIEPTWLKTERFRIPIASLPAAFDGYRIVQLSDLHVHDVASRANAEQAVQRALSLAPDLIVVTGDYVTEFVHPNLYATLRPLTAPDGVLTIVGNHDHWTDVGAVRQVLEDARLPELRNSATFVERQGQQLWIAGVDDIWEKHHDLNAALSNVPPDAPTILLAHEPDFADSVYSLNRVSLQLSGHSHGGQVTVPGLGSPVVPYLGEKYVRGLRKLGSMWLYTNRGVGNLTPVRFNCRPEVTEFTLTRAI